MDILIIVCLSLAFIVIIGMIIFISIYSKKVKTFANWLQFQINSNTELMKMSATIYEQGLFCNGARTAYTEAYNKFKSFN